MVRKQQFTENFSGAILNDVLRSIQRQGTGGSASMIDDVDEGFEINTGGSGGQWCVDLGDIQHYDQTACFWHFVVRRSSANQWSNAGMGNNMHLSPSDHFCVWQDQAEVTFKRIQTKDGTSQTQTSSTVGQNQNWTNYACRMTSAAMLGWINGNFEVIKTNNLPTKGGNPCIQRGTGTSHTMRIRYMEAYNIE